MTALTVPTRRRPAAVLLAIVLLAVAAAGCMPTEERTFYDRTNGLRASVGVPYLQENDTLTQKAESWAQYMAATGRLEHSNLPDGLGGLPWTVLAENIAVSGPTADTLATMHAALVASPPHYLNLVDPRFTHMGVGLAQSADGRLWVAEVFATL